MRVVLQDETVRSVKALADMTMDLLDAMGCANDVHSQQVVTRAVTQVTLLVAALEQTSLSLDAHSKELMFQQIARDAWQHPGYQPSTSLALAVQQRNTLAATQRNMNMAMRDSITVAAQAYQQDRDQQRELDEKAKLVFSYWAAVTNRPRAVFDERRRSRIVSRLKENGGDADELLYAIDGAMKDPWLSGKDPKTNGRKYDGVETILRDRAQVERLAETQRGHQRSEPHPLHEIQRRQAEAGGRRAE
ncbi:MAG: hypothetical protein ACK5VI_10685 [Opitutia bacterium]|jgi:acyl-CoA hydrolase